MSAARKVSKCMITVPFHGIHVSSAAYLTVRLFPTSPAIPFFSTLCSTATVVLLTKVTSVSLEQGRPTQIMISIGRSTTFQKEKASIKEDMRWVLCLMQVERWYGERGIVCWT